MAEIKVNWTATHAQSFGLPPQGENESDGAFRERISGSLREMGRSIEAHEAYQNSRYEDSADVMTGVLGAMARVLEGTDNGWNGSNDVGDDIAAGTLVRNPEQEYPADYLLLMTMFSDPKRPSKRKS